MTRIRHTLPAALCLVLVSAVPNAAALTAIDAATKTCQDRIVLETGTFVTARYQALAKCMKAAMACKTLASPSGQRTCLGKLLVPVKGDCAVGKLDSGNATIGAGAAERALDGSTARLDAALATLVAGLDTDCFGVVPADLSSLANGLGFPADVANAVVLADELNREPGGLGCLALEKLVGAVPRAQELAVELQALHHKCLKVGAGVPLLADCTTDAACGIGGVCGQLAFAVNQASITCCAAGTVRAGGSCVPCEPGSFADGSAGGVCTECPTGQFTHVAGLPECIACPTGQFSAAPGATACAACPAGKYAADPGASVCAECPAGRFSGPGASVCNACPAGTSSASGATTCAACEPGTFASAGSATCIPCGAGTASGAGAATCAECPSGTSSASGSASCSPCAAGTFAAASGSEACAPCEAGTFSAAGSSMCSPCAPGRFANATGQTECQECPAGQYSAEAGAATCVACQPGTFAAATGSTTCIGCADGTAAPTSATAECAACPANATSNATHTLCLCDAGYYGTTVNGAFTCVACPEGADCSQPGTTLETLTALPGWWTPTSGSLQFYRCLLSSQCPGGDS